MAIQLSDHFTYRKLLRFVFPSIIMMVFTSIYGVVDGLFISNFVGKIPFAAINLVMPFIMILSGVGFMIGTGGSALVAKTLGEGRRDDANRYFTMMIIFACIVGAVLSLIGFIFMKPVSIFLGATDEMLSDCVVYGRTVLMFNIAFFLQNMFQSFFVTAEKPKLGLLATVAAGFCNMFLDALFIAIFKWGVIGAALATGLSQCVGGILPLFYFARKNSSLLRIKKTKLEVTPIIRSCINGSSEMMTNISSSIVAMLYNFQLLKFAGENGVAAYGVLMYVQFIFIAIFVGYAIGSAPIVGYHYGAENHSEMKNIKEKSIFLMTAFGVLMLVLAQILASPLSHIFVGYDGTLFEMTKHAFRISAITFLFAGINIYISSFFTALNNGVVSAVISFLRTLVFQLAAVLLLPIFFELEGVWCAGLTSELCAFAVSIIFLVGLRKKYNY